MYISQPKNLKGERSPSSHLHTFATRKKCHCPGSDPSDYKMASPFAIQTGTKCDKPVTFARRLRQRSAGRPRGNYWICLIPTHPPRMEVVHSGASFVLRTGTGTKRRLDPAPCQGKQNLIMRNPGTIRGYLRNLDQGNLVCSRHRPSPILLSGTSG